MKIEGANITIQAQHHYHEEQQVYRIEQITPEVAPIENNAAETQDVIVDISKHDPKLQLIKLLFYSLTGREMETIEEEVLHKKLTEQSASITFSGTLSELVNQAESGSLSIQQIEQYYEHEQLNVVFSGTFTNDAGETIEVSHQLSMSRSYAEINYLELQSQEINLKDPLVINFNSSGTELSSNKVAFDIDADGVLDNISTPINGSGFLALDKNQNKVIDNGSELFGALSGNGFKELSSYDIDNNGFIDKSDPIFKQLTIVNANKSLTLKEANIAAISLQSAASPYTIKDSNQQMLGVIKSTGFAVTEEGQVKTVQQLDLVI